MGSRHIWVGLTAAVLVSTAAIQFIGSDSGSAENAANKAGQLIDVTPSSSPQTFIKHQAISNNASLRPNSGTLATANLNTNKRAPSPFNADAFEGYDDHEAALNSLVLNHGLLQDDSSAEGNIIANLLGDWIAKDPEAVWWWLESNDPTGTLDRFRHAIVQSWFTKDTDAALFAISGLAKSPLKVQLLSAYAAYLVVDEPQRAFYWAFDLIDNDERKHTLDRVVYQWAGSDPEQVISHLNGITDIAFREQLIQQAGPSITAQLTQMNPYNALEWVDSLSDNEQLFLKPIAFQQWVNADPHTALNWLSSSKSPEHAQPYMTTVSQSLAYQNLPMALEVFPNQNEKVRIDMAASISFRLYQQDPYEAQSWSNNLLNPYVQLSADKGILLASIDDDPQNALQMAVDYTGDDRNELLVTTATEVDQQHPNLLDNWLISAPLTDNQRTNIRHALVRNPAE